MNRKEISEIRRRLRADKSNITRICGCFVNSTKEIVSKFSETLLLMPEELAEKYLSIFRRTLSGRLGRNLIDIEFTTTQVSDGDEHKLLMSLRESELDNGDITDAFFKKVIDSLVIEGSYLILLMTDTYDVPRKSSDGGNLEDSQSQFKYILCSVCPVHLTKSALGYCAENLSFHSTGVDQIVGAPSLGFMFPSFDDRATNIYGAMYYTADVSSGHSEFTDAIFNTDNMPMPAEAQKDTFQSIIAESLKEECSYEIVQNVRTMLCDMITEHDADKTETEPLVISKNEVKSVLESCGVSAPKVEAFAAKYDEEFGVSSGLRVHNIVDKALKIETPDVVIKVNPERADLVETRVIDGVKYIMIRADSGVELNGLNVEINE